MPTLYARLMPRDLGPFSEKFAALSGLGSEKSADEEKNSPELRHREDGALPNEDFRLKEKGSNPWKQTRSGFHNRYAKGSQRNSRWERRRVSNKEY